MCLDPKWWCLDSLQADSEEAETMFFFFFFLSSVLSVYLLVIHYFSYTHFNFYQFMGIFFVIFLLYYRGWKMISNASQRSLGISLDNFLKSEVKVWARTEAEKAT